MNLPARKFVAPFDHLKDLRGRLGRSPLWPQRAENPPGGSQQPMPAPIPFRLLILGFAAALAILSPVLPAGLTEPNQAWAGEAGNDAAGATALPARNVIVPLEQIEKICARFGLDALWAKIAKDPPARPFKSDGCSLWFNKWQGYDLYPACFRHDLKYWAGYPGESVERLVADSELMIEVARIMGSTKMAETMFAGVRVGGGGWTRASFAWGFGRVRP